MKTRGILIIVAGLVVALTFQACVGIDSIFSSRGGKRSNLSGNGEPYGGKPRSYEAREPQNPCAEIGKDGVPLPNHQIFGYGNGTKQSVREGCRDIVPVTLNEGDIQVTPTGDIIYKARTYILNTSSGDFDVVAADCPAARAPLPSPVRSNMVTHSQDLMAADWGGGVQGLTITPEGALGSLPLYTISRNSPSALENYRRPSQNPMQVAGETYVFSFYAAPSAEEALFISDSAGIQDLEIVFNLNTGASTVLVSTGTTNVSTSARPFGGGLFISVYFTALISGNVHVGVAANSENVGSSISTTAFQLERVANFCAP